MKAPGCHLCRKGHIRITQFANVYSCDSCRVGFGKPDSAPNRIGCCVPFCRASRGDRKDDQIVHGMEWICSRHWRSVSPRLKRRRTKLARIRRRTNDPARQRLIDKVDSRVWQSCKREAIEAAGGIG